MGIKRGTTLAAVAVVVVLAATACNGDDKADKADAAKPAGATAAAPAADPYAGGGGAGAAAAKPAGALAVSTTDKLGPVLTDSAGFTLYRFDKDTAKPPASNCDGDCAKAWPVVPAGDASAAAGMDPSLLGEVVRKDGSKQLTVAGWPAYRFAKDTKAGDLGGQGVGGTWFALAPDGKKAAKAAAPAPAGTPGQAAGALTVAKDPALGEHIVDGNGMTVYRFKPDTAWPMVSKCTGDCLAKWPVVPPAERGSGIVEKNYLVLDRPDGKKQQTVNCWPVYTFTGDKKPGDVNGQGVGGTWYAVAPDGKLIGAQ
ncbi:SCO0930 family lipoprotein [Streptomyces katrae]|uniref:Lipoprotein n=1 Tax=Streptomyces katrae TaxID=68223 RepID=A0A0F4JUX0_9ACTN|nr:SCO0930 family lipoprotein [Streptomyces katrae]KJY37538.1 lipoprotein [Streptomyces katrae]